MSLRKPCSHDRYEEHPCIDGRWVSQARMMKLKPEERPLLTMCPGGEFLPEGALVIEKVEGEWPHAVAKVIYDILAEDLDNERDRLYLADIRSTVILDALASQVGESER